MLPVGMDMDMSFNHQHSEGPWHFGIAAVRHVVQASCRFFRFLLLSVINESYEHLGVQYAKWVDEGPVLRADLVPVLYQVIWRRVRMARGPRYLGRVLYLFCSGHVAIMI